MDSEEKREVIPSIAGGAVGCLMSLFVLGLVCYLALMFFLWVTGCSVTVEELQPRP